MTKMMLFNCFKTLTPVYQNNDLYYITGFCVRKVMSKLYLSFNLLKGESNGETGRFAQVSVPGKNFKKAAYIVAFGNENSRSTNTAFNRR